MTTRCVSQVVRIPELIDPTDGSIHGWVFEDCDVYGPAVLIGVDDSPIVACDLGPSAEAVFWLVEDGRDLIAGATKIRDCRFEGCRFHNVGFVETPEARAARLAPPPAQ